VRISTGKNIWFYEWRSGRELPKNA